MADRPKDLPDFVEPPLEEVVLSIQFNELPDYRTVHAGLLWKQQFRNRYPLFSEHPPLQTVFETFGNAANQPIQLQISAVAGPKVPRLWFMNKDLSELIQIQSDRFSHNWRKVATGEEYPRYEKIKSLYLQEIDALVDFIEAESLGSLLPNQCEITYVNHIKAPDDLSPAEVFTQLSDDLSEIVEAPVKAKRETFGFNTTSVLFDAQSTPIGRLHVAMQTVFDQDGKRLFRCDLTARGAPKSSDIKSVSEFLDLGREIVVRHFTAITTKRMHDVWGRKS